MTRKVILYIATSIDGFIADSAGGIEWLSIDETSELEKDETYNEFYKEIDTVIMGRTTYDQVVNELSPDFYPYENKINYVLTNREGDNRANVNFSSENVIDLVERVRNENGKALWIVGGNSVIMPLVENNLIDEYRIATVPVILGKGIPLFNTFNKSLFLKLKESHSINSICYYTFTK
ncbi:dihydrofolate reductase family protein [Carnobacterium maltaromaticum]|uniref:dihydrofolate reductase family protein n=1 Tax=Carnobacterium maltaromaticum TaxID=2751 RepID=UPI003B980E96